MRAHSSRIVALNLFDSIGRWHQQHSQSRTKRKSNSLFFNEKHFNSASGGHRIKYSFLFTFVFGFLFVKFIWPSSSQHVEFSTQLYRRFTIANGREYSIFFQSRITLCGGQTAILIAACFFFVSVFRSRVTPFGNIFPDLAT